MHLIPYLIQRYWPYPRSLAKVSFLLLTFIMWKTSGGKTAKVQGGVTASISTA